MTQLEMAKKGVVTTQMKAVAYDEGVDTGFVMRGIADGTIVIPANIGHIKLKPCGIGKGLRTKVNVNLGTSQDCNDIELELEKVRVAEKYGADAVMDLSTGGDINEIRRKVISTTSLTIGTVPIYQAGIGAIAKRGSIVDMTAGDMFAAIEEQAKDGVDFVTVHCGVTQAVIARLKKAGRLTGIVSRGGAFL
ncbi:MAG: phosphomethylpyrimidine synthase ThiC, partial [Dehalococcoidia bacterium]|nr:phosphomethylpyrimidine synthase ThiC [Dehalococcoidia bacterium]